MDGTIQKTELNSLKIALAMGRRQWELLQGRVVSESLQVVGFRVAYSHIDVCMRDRNIYFNLYCVYEGAKWMACDGCGSVGCYERELIACAEFITCPQ